MPDGLSDIPALVWVVGGLMVAAALRYAQLWARRRRHADEQQGSLRGLRLLYDGLSRFARYNGNAWPASLEGDDWAFARPYVVRALPRWGFDDRLVIAYEREPRHRLIEFPSLRPGRAVLLSTGKVVVLSQPQFEQLMAADSRLRETLGLDPLDTGVKA
jgi:hypothetical protein